MGCKIAYALLDGYVNTIFTLEENDFKSKLESKVLRYLYL